ncbi:MAG TPA: hypothetical protein VJC03_07855, partial [bacterium]|nr:hypothetical protein [bacterium]
NQSGDDTWYDSDPGEIFDVDFADTENNLDRAYYTLYSSTGMTGSVIRSWTEIFSGLGQDLYTQNWETDFLSAQEGYNYASVRVYNVAGDSNTVPDVFYLKKDVSVPTVTNNESGGDSAWRRTSRNYNLDFHDAGSRLDYVQYQVWSQQNQTGVKLKDWTTIASNINTANYTADWPVDFSSLQQGTNYVSVRAYDQLAKSAVFPDRFYIKKDTQAPTITDNQAGSDTWYASNPGNVFNVDFADSLSLFTTSYYTVYTSTWMTGSPVMNWTLLVSTQASSYVQNWGIQFSSFASGTNYVFVKARDSAGNEKTQNNYVFYVKKDTEAPTITDNQAGDYTWRSSSGTTYNIDFSDNKSLLDYLQYRIVSGTGGVILDWYTFASNVNASSYDTDFSLPSSRFSLLPASFSYVSVRAYDKLGNTRMSSNVFYIKKDTVSPTVEDYQVGVDTWYASNPGSIFNVDFRDTLSGVDICWYAVYASSNMQGTKLKDWTAIASNVNALFYTADWGVDFSACQQGRSWVSVKVRDYAGKETITRDVFYVQKDITNPAITDNQSGDDSWYSSDPGAVFNVDFTDSGGSKIEYIQYKVHLGTWTGTALKIDWTDIETDVDADSYTDNWGLNFDSLENEVLNYVWVRVFDNAGNSAESSGYVFYVRKAVSEPEITNNIVDGDTTWRRINSTYYDVDFSSKGPSQLSYFQTIVYSTMNWGGTLIDDWRTAAADINAAYYTSDWKLKDETWAKIPEGKSWVSVRVYDEAYNVKCSTDVFYVLKDTHSVSISVNQTGDFTWRKSSGTLYDIDYTDIGPSNIQKTEYKIVSGTGGVIVDWYPYADNISSTSYSDDFSLSTDHFSLLPSSFAYVSVRAYDYALNLSSRTDAFYIKKDTSPPTISNGEEDEDPVWRNSGRTYDVDFLDNLSRIQKAEYTVFKATGMKAGEEVLGWSPIISSTETAHYQLDWSLDFDLLEEGTTNYVSVRCLNWAGSTTTIADVFYVLKDTTLPQMANSLPDGDTTWRKTNSGSYNIDFADTGGSNLFYMETQVWKGPGQSVGLADDWRIQISSIGSGSFLTDWQMKDETWDNLIQGKNYVTVRAWDGSGSSSQTIDAFYILKDTAFPVFSNYETGGDTAWVNSSQYYNVDFSDLGSGLKGAKYAVYSSTGMQGTEILGWQDIFTSTRTEHTADWQVFFSSLTPGYNYVTLEVFDLLFQTTTVEDAFFIKKDTAVPYMVNTQAGDTSWRNTNDGAYNIDFYDIGHSSLAYYQTRASTLSAGGVYLYGWETESSIGLSSYTVNWPLSADHWSLLMEGVTNYVSVKVTDLAGNTSSWTNA